MVATHKKYFITSLVLHAGVLLLLVLGFDRASPLVVIENTNKHDVISAVILGDTVKSRILPAQQPVEKPEPKVETKVTPKAEPKIVPKTVAIKIIPQKKPADIFGKDLLADINKLKKQAEKNKKLKQQAVLKAQIEKTMRQQLLNEEVKFKSTQTREAQGIVNKYQGLIVQAISEHWVIPSTANKKLSSLLMIRLAPSGMVLDVQIIKSSGDVALDSSARAAVFNASPLPVPRDAAAFESSRQFHLKVRPQDIIDAATLG